MTELLERAKVFLRDAEQSPEGQRLLRGNVKDVNLMAQFEPKDDEPFFVEIINGKVEVKQGRLLSTSYEYPRFRVTQKDLIDIFMGKVRPFAAKRSGKWDFITRDRRGGIFTVLVRIGQDVVRERIIQSA